MLPRNAEQQALRRPVSLHAHSTLHSPGALSVEPQLKIVTAQNWISFFTNNLSGFSTVVRVKRGRLPAVRVKRGRLPAELFVLAMSLDLDGVLRASGELERAGHIEACFAVMHGFKERNASRMVRVALGNEVKVVASASPRVCILAVGMLQL